MDDVLVGVIEVDDVAVEELLVDEVEVLDDDVDVEDVLADEVELEDVVGDEVHEDAVEVEWKMMMASSRLLYCCNFLLMKCWTEKMCYWM